MSDGLNDSTPGSSGRPVQWTPPTVEEAARLFPNFDGFSMIGYGGMGAVYKARQMALDRDVAIKLLPLEVSADASFAERFAREARAMGKLSHPNIVAVHDFGQTAEGHLFIVMDFVEGATLHQLIHHSGLMPDDALSIVEQVCDALDYAHGRGVVHRDVKPANVLVGRDGVAKVADFGLASVSDANAPDDGRPQVTMTGMVMGTPDYMAPEQRHGMNVDHRADIYSLGVILYESLVGEVPRGVFDPPSHRVKVDKRLDAVVIHAMQQQVDRRFQHTREMRAAITAIRKGSAPSLSPAPSPASEIAPAKSRAPLYAIAAVVAVAVIVTVTMLREKPPVLTAAEKAAAEAKNKPVPTPEPTPKPAIAETEPPKPPKPEPEPQTPKASVPMEVQKLAGHRYQFVAAPGLSWLQAKRKAEEMGGHLVAITTKDENDWVGNTFVAGLESGVLWIGATNSSPEGKWMWVTGDPVEFNHWAPAAKRTTTPDSAAGIARGTTVQNSLWGTWPAAMEKWDHARGFIVEWDDDGTKPAPPLAGAVNLLTRVDIVRDTVEGKWSLEGAELIRGEGEGQMRIALPAQPPEEYDLQFAFTQKVRSDLVTAILPWGTQAVQWTMNHGGIFAFEMVNGAALGPENPSHRKRDTLPLNQRHTVLLQVRRGEIKAFVNGELISELKGPAETKLHPIWSMKDPRSLGLGTFVPTSFHAIELRPLGPVTPANPDADVPTLGAAKVDVLAAMEPDLDKVQGGWVREGDAVRFTGAAANHHPRFQLPFTVKGSYLVEVDFTPPTEGGSLVVHLPIARQEVARFSDVTFHLGRNAGFEFFGGVAVGGSSNPAWVNLPAPPSKRTRVLVKVEVLDDDRVGFTAWQDGQRLVAWKGGRGRLSGAANIWRPRDEPQFAFGTKASGTVFHSIRVEPLGGSIDWQRKPPEPKPVEPPKPTVPPASPEVVKWLGEQEAVFSTQWKKDAVAPFDAAVAKLREQYAAAIEKNLTAATNAAKLDDALSWRNEKARIAAQMPHEAEDATSDPVALKGLRASWRAQFAKLDSERFNRAKLVHGKFDALLDQGQKGYTQRQRLDDAQLLKMKRDEVREAWLTPPFDGTKAAPPKKPMGETMAPRKPATVATGALAGREAILHLRSIGFYVSFLDGDGTSRQVTHNNQPEDVPTKGRLEITSLTTPGLRRLNASPEPITDKDFADLAPMRALRNFEIRANEVTGTGFAFLAGSPELNRFHVESAKLTDAALEPLLGLRKITHLSFENTAEPLKWTRIGEMASLPSLTDFFAHRVEGIAPDVLARARKLVRLRLESSRITDAHLAAIASLPDLEWLTLTGLDETGTQGLRHLEKSLKLTSLEITATTGTHPNLAAIGKMRKLATLFLDGHAAEGLAAAAGAPALRTISLAGAAGTQGATDAGMKVIAAAFPRLETLNFVDFAERAVTPAGIRELAVMPKLRALTWGKRPLSVEHATALAELPALESLIIGNCEITEAQLAEIAKSKTITHLDIAHQKLMPAAVEVLKTMRGLRDVFVYNCNLSADDIASLRKALPKCKVRDQ